MDKMDRLLRLLRGEPAGFGHALKIDPAGGKLRDLRAAARGQELDFEYLGAEHLPDGAFVHREGVAVPIPAVAAVAVAHTNANFHLRLSPEPGAVGWRKGHAGVELARLQTAVLAEELNPRLLKVSRAAQRVISGKLELDATGSGHLVLRIVFPPVAAGAGAVGLGGNNKDRGEEQKRISEKRS